MTAPQCRFCLENDEEQNLIQPCACSGTSAFVHLSCLQKWQVSMQSANTRAADERGAICSSCRHMFDPPPPSELAILGTQLQRTNVLSSLGMDTHTCIGRDNVLFSLIIASIKMSTPPISNSSSAPSTQPPPPSPSPSSSSSSSNSWRTVRERIVANIRGTSSVPAAANQRNAYTLGGANTTMVSALLALVELKRAHWMKGVEGRASEASERSKRSEHCGKGGNQWERGESMGKGGINVWGAWGIRPPNTVIETKLDTSLLYFTTLL